MHGVVFRHPKHPLVRHSELVRLRGPFALTRSERDNQRAILSLGVDHLNDHLASLVSICLLNDQFVADRRWEVINGGRIFFPRSRENTPRKKQTTSDRPDDFSEHYRPSGFGRQSIT